MLVYESINTPLIDLLPPDSKNILDIGCGNGALGKHLKLKFPQLQITGITYSEEEAKIAETTLDKVIVADLNNYDFHNLNNFDCIICSHVLEHLYQPEIALQKIKIRLSENGKLIIALPNVLHWKQRLKFLRGSFRYTEGGLMDKTHFKFFDWETAKDLIESSGFTIITARAYGAFPLSFIRRFLPKSIGEKLDGMACSLFPGLFGFQFVFSSKVKK